MSKLKLVSVFLPAFLFIAGCDDSTQEAVTDSAKEAKSDVTDMVSTVKDKANAAGEKATEMKDTAAAKASDMAATAKEKVDEVGEKNQN